MHALPHYLIRTFIACRLRLDLGVLCLLLIGSLVSLGVEEAQGRSPLHGSATVEAGIPEAANAYRPRQSTIVRADAMAAGYKLKAAETLYRQVLKHNSKSPGGWNGLGKIAYFKTTSSNQNWRSQTDELYTQAIQHFMTALRYQPGYVEAHVNLASVYMEQGLMGEAALHLDQALRLSPNNDYALEKRGEWLVRQERYNDALPVLKQAIKRNSSSVSAHYYLGVAYAARNELDAALENLNTTLWLDPDNAPAHYQMGLIYEKQGNGAAAVEHYLKAVSLKPELADARLKLATHYELRGDLAPALEQLRNVLDAQETPDWELTDRVGRLAIRNQQAEYAVKAYRNWLNEHPGDAQGNSGLSMAKAQLAKQKLRDDDLVSQGEAKRYAEQAIKYQPNNFEARMINTKLDNQIGGTNPLKGKDPAMVDVALQNQVFQPYQSYEKGELLLARYQFQAAEQAFRQARLAGEGNRSQMVFGELFLAKGLPTLAEEAFKSVLKQLPGNASARLGIAKADEARQQALTLLVEAQGNQRKDALPVAIMQLEKALSLDVKNAQAHYMLGQLYEKMDDYAPAADHYYAYIQLEPSARNANSVKRKIENLKLKIARQKSQGQR